MHLPLATATDVVAQLDLSLSETPVCLPCLSFVSASVRADDRNDAWRWAKEMAPLIWEEGLAEPAFDAVRGAVEQGVADADACVEDLTARGGRSVVARAIVMRLAEELAEEERRFAVLHRLAQKAAPPEWN